MKKNSCLKLIDISNDISKKNFINTIYNFELNQDSVLKNYKIDQKANSNIKYSFNNIEQDINSVSETFILSSGSNFIKNEIKPELEIYADDVKCSHGSTSGNLNQDSIFYLMSRGLNYKQAKELLINGFLLDVVEKITDPEVRNLIKNLIGVKEWILVK